MARAVKPRAIKVRIDEYFDRRETRSPAARQKAQIAGLQALLVRARKSSPYYREILKGYGPVRSPRWRRWQNCR